MNLDDVSLPVKAGKVSDRFALSLSAYYTHEDPFLVKAQEGKDAIIRRFGKCGNKELITLALVLAKKAIEAERQE